MKKQLLTIFSIVLATFAFQTANAQNYSSAPIASGFNTDVIANGTGSSAVSTDNDVDGVNFAFVSMDFLLTPTSTPLTYGLPISGNFTSVVASTPGLMYQLGPYTGNNDLRLKLANDSGSLTLATPVAATTVYILATSGSGTSTISATITFTDASTQNVTSLAVADWYNAAGFALQGIGRISRQTDILENGGGTNPRLYQIPIAIDAANQSKQIQSVTFIKTAGIGTANIFAISVDQYTTCPAPTFTANTNITQSSATINWTAPSTVPSNGYDVYYSTSNIAPVASTVANITGVTGLNLAVTGLMPNTVYYVWVRSNCGGTAGPWSFPNTFKTACGPISSMSEDFESYATGNIVPDCWARLVSGTGSMSISSATPTGSGIRQIYQYSSTTANSTVVVLPVFSNVNAGTNWLKMKTRTSSTVGVDIQIGYVTDPADAATFVSLFDVTITNLVYTDLNANRTFIIPNLIPANARLAVKNTGTKTGSFYWDDVIWEAIPACQEPFNPVKTGATTTSIALSWTAPATAPASYDIYYSTTNVAPTSISTPQVTGISGTTKDVTGLTPSTSYYFWVRSNCGSSQSAWIGSVVAYTGTCLPAGGTTSTSYYLNNITTTGGFTNLGYTASSYNAYVDNSSSNLDSVAGAVINYTLGTSSGTNYYYIWIDYNNDLDFDDAGETILATTSYSAGQTGSFTIPVTIPQGTYRMRFAQSYIGQISSCGPAPYGSYVDYTLSLGAPPTCIAPTAVVVSGVTSVSAIVDWTASITPPTGGYDVYYSTTNTAPTATSTPNTNVSGTTATISSLSPATTYYVWVRSHCSATDLSAWSISASFITACTTFTTPYTQNFDTTATGSSTNNNAPTCWSYLETSQSVGYGYVYGFNANSAPNSYYLYNAGDLNGNIMLLSPPTTNLGSGNKRVRFQARGSVGYTLEVGILTDTSDPSTFFAIPTTGTINLTAGYVEYTVNLPAATYSNVVFRHGLGGTFRGIYLDDITVEDIPTCVKPLDVLVNTISTNTATVTWTAPITVPANGYQVYYSTTNTAPTTTVLDATNSATSATTSANITGLTPATTYYAFVRSICSTTDQSVWTASTTFTTACAAVAVPFSETFSNGTLPNCWSNFSANNAGYALWRYSGAPDYGTTNNGSTAGTYVWVDASTPYTGIHDVTLQSPQINLAGVATPMVQFKWFKNHATTATGTTVPPYDNNKLTVMVRDITTATWDTVFADSTNDPTWRTVMVNLPASYVGKTIELRFIVDKDVAANGYFYDNVLLDDVEVKQSTLATSETNIKGNNITLYPNPFTDFIRISDVKEVTAVSIVDMSGRLVKTMKPATELRVGDLKSGMYLINLTLKDGSVKTVKAIKK